jgi:aryl sulfotransferase
MSQIVWIASYPKSGNTWVRFLVCNLLYGPIDSAATLGRLVPDIHELRADTVEAPSSPVLMKTHYPYSPALPLAMQTAGAIYVVRDPADVMLSNYYYRRRSGAALPDGEADFEQYLESFIAAHGDPRWLQLGMGCWDGNVRSWLTVQHPFPVLRIRYEDLLADGIGVAGLLARSLGVVADHERLATAVESASFESMRRIEEADIRAQRVGIFYKPYLQGPIDAGLRFMRSGRSGESSAKMSPRQWQRFNAAFGAIRAEFGYC